MLIERTEENGDTVLVHDPRLTPEAIEFLSTLPRTIRTCEAKYPLALALVDLGLMVLRFRTVLGFDPNTCPGCGGNCQTACR